MGGRNGRKEEQPQGASKQQEPQMISVEVFVVRAGQRVGVAGRSNSRSHRVKFTSSEIDAATLEEASRGQIGGELRHLWDGGQEREAGSSSSSNE